MAAVHRPDFQAFRKESSASRHAGTKYRDHFMWPYINQEDLVKPKTLLLLLNSRGRHPPPSFAAADVDAMHLGKVLFAIQPVFLNSYVFILHGAATASEYGRLVAWEDHPDAFDWMISRKQFIPGEGLLVLEAQQRLLRFLVKCCRSVLKDIPDAELVSNKFPILPEPRLKTEAEVDGFESLAVMAAEAPYRVPQHLDLARVRSLLEAITSAAEDHLWALREDPGYFSESILDYKEHRQEMLPDTLKKAHPATSKAHSETLWSRVIGNVVTKSYIQLEIFSELSHQAQVIQSLYSKYDGKLSPVKDLPLDYLKALLKFRYFLEQAAKGPLNQLKHVVVASPPIRHLFVRQPPPNPLSSKIVIMSRPGIELSDIEEQVVWLLRTLWEDEQPLFLARLTTIIDELERLLQSEPEAKSLISAYVASTIGDLSIIAQCQRQLELFQPWANSFDHHSVDHLEDIKEQYTVKTKKWRNLISNFQEDALKTSRIVSLGEPTGKRFDYPVGKRRTQQNVEMMRQAEANLDAFWASIDQLMQKGKASIEGTAVNKLLSLGRELQRTPEWSPPPKNEPDTENKTPSHDAIDELLTKPFSTLYFDSKSSSPSANERTAKTKIKTRGMSSLIQGEETDNKSDQNTMDPQPTFTVDPRAFKVFRTIFFNPRVTSTPGEVSWADFLHAMSSTGFVAQKIYGSVWQFKPTKLDVEKSIQYVEIRISKLQCFIIGSANMTYSGFTSHILVARSHL